LPDFAARQKGPVQRSIVIGSEVPPEVRRQSGLGFPGRFGRWARFLLPWPELGLVGPAAPDGLSTTISAPHDFHRQSLPYSVMP
jgi:hypothetical protein